MHKQSLRDNSIKSFYASGFLYSLKTHQILLLSSGPKDDISSAWSMLGGEVKQGEEAPVAFARIIYKLFKVQVEAKQIHPIYDYFHDGLDRTNYVFYAEVKNPQVLSSLEKTNFSWIAFHQTVKLLFSNHTKQDVIVGERVINLKQRLDLNLQ